MQKSGLRDLLQTANTVLGKSGNGLLCQRVTACQ